MSKTGAWVLELTEDADNITRDQFIKTHGYNNVDTWDDAERARKIECELLPSANAILKELSNDK